MKKTLLLLLLCSLTTGLSAQNILSYEDESKIGDAYANPGDTARVVIRCHESTPLMFYSRADGGFVNPVNVTKEGSYNLYDLNFRTDAAEVELNLLSRRVLLVSSQNYNNLEIPLNLVSKQCVKLKVFDPNDNKLNTPYIRLRNEAFEEFKALNYAKARQLFYQASLMSDANKSESTQNLNMVDSVMSFREKADEAYNKGSFYEAYQYYDKVIALNNDDTYANQRRLDSSNQFRSTCELAYMKAEMLYDQKQYAQAKEQYQIMIDEKCSEHLPVYSTVQARIRLIDDLLRSKKEHATVITYEYAKDTPIGIHYGKYKEHKWGGFFQLDMNQKIFEAIRSNATFGDKPEANLSFGWTVKLIKPVWLFFGPGVTGKMYYGEFQEEKFPTKDYSDTSEIDRANLIADADLTKANVGVAISPVIGLLVKYSYFAVRATYQYRFSIDKNLEDFIGKQRFSFGVGFAF